MSYPTADFKLTPTGLLNSSSLVMGQISNNLNLLPSNPTNISTGFQKMANLDFTTQGIHLLRIGWANAYNTSGNSVYWGSEGVGVICIRDQNAGYYNTSPSDNITMHWLMHHRNINLPTVRIDSDETNGNYGDPCVYISFPQTIRLLSPSCRVQQIGPS